MALSTVENQRVTKKVKMRKSLLVNRNSFAVSQSVETCFTHSSIDAARRKPQILVRKIRKEFEVGITHFRRSVQENTLQKIMLWRKSAFLRNHRIKGDPLFVAHHAIIPITENISINDPIFRKLDPDTEDLPNIAITNTAIAQPSIPNRKRFLFHIFCERYKVPYPQSKSGNERIINMSNRSKNIILISF
jgi:hypothetical protein